jgi:HD-GYP domain-containing protein (c-di-GMP phosphodiesterase class II)
MAVTQRAPRLCEELAGTHEELRRDLPGISRIAVAVYDVGTDRLTTFVHSTDGRAPIALHEARLADVPSLAELAELRRDRVVDDLEVFRDSPAAHSRLLLESGYRSSFTRPFYDRGELAGFVFFDSHQPAYFTPSVVADLRVYAHLVPLLVVNSLTPAQLLRSVVEVAREMSAARDQETGAHLDRMARYAHLIAREVAAREGRDDAFVEFVFLFAPLHDLGKIAIPDDILLKEGPLSEAERECMHGHVERGLELVDSLARAFGIGDSEHFGILRNIVGSHHEAFDGSGYPLGLVGHQIPLEARIAAVADVFDALTSPRPYKLAWTNDEAFAYFEDLAGTRFDAECVRALVTRRAEVEAIQQRFATEADPLASFHEARLETN